MSHDCGRVDDLMVGYGLEDMDDLKHALEDWGRWQREVPAMSLRAEDQRDAVYAAVHEELMQLRVKLHGILNGRSDIDNIVYHAQNRACAAAVAALKVGLRA